MTYPISIAITFDFSSGPSFSPPFQIGYSRLGFDVLGSTTSPSQIVELQDQTQSITIKRGRDLNQDRFNSGTCALRVLDPNGDWNPQNTASPYYGQLQPLRKVSISATYNGVIYPLYAGYTIAYNYSYPKNEDLGYVDIQCVDAFALFTKSAVTTVTGATAGETTGSRITDVLNTIGFPTSQRNLDTGVVTVQSDPGTLRSVLQALQDLEFTEYGALYMDATGDIVFRQRTDLVQALAQTPRVFDQTTGINYANLKLAFDDKLVFNVANFTRVGGTTQTFFSQSSIDTYFPHTITKTDLMQETDAAVLDLAKAYVSNRSTTDIRIDAMTLDLTTPNYAAGIQAALGIDFLDPVTISNEQPGGSIITKTLQVFGVQHQITPTNWFTTFTTSEPILKGFIIGNTTYGKLGVSKL